MGYKTSHTWIITRLGRQIAGCVHRALVCALNSIRKPSETNDKNNKNIPMYLGKMPWKKQIIVQVACNDATSVITKVP